MSIFIVTPEGFAALKDSALYVGKDAAAAKKWIRTEAEKTGEERKLVAVQDIFSCGASVQRKVRVDFASGRKRSKKSVESEPKAPRVAKPRKSTKLDPFAE